MPRSAVPSRAAKHADGHRERGAANRKCGKDRKEREMSDELEKARDLVLDGDGGDVVEVLPDATWEALCEVPEVKEIVADFGPRYGRMVMKYRPFLSFERHQALSRKHHMDDAKKRNVKGFMVDILRDVLVAPRITEDRHERLVMKARFDILNKIILDTIGSEAEEMDAIREELGP
jgi:hypothetical protein